MVFLFLFARKEKVAFVLVMSEIPLSAYEEIEGLPYFRRMCDKIRKMEAGVLREDFQANLGKAMDLWACQLFAVTYEDLANVVKAGASDEEVLVWARKNGVEREPFIVEWWKAYIMKFGFQDHMSERLEERKVESGLEGRVEIQTFVDYMEADEERI